MSELIDREAVREFIKSYRHSTDVAFDMEKRLDEIPAASPWHRVELEEPTKAGWYLVMDVDGDFNVDEWHNTFGWQFVTPSDADRITYWMPIEWMPIEPPKEGEA